MIESHVRKLGRERRVEYSRRMLKTLMRRKIPADKVLEIVMQAEIKKENPYASPDFTCLIGVASRNRPWDLVAVQTPDGRAVRLFGLLQREGRG